MNLRVIYGDPPSALARLWGGALEGCIVRHPDREVPVTLVLRDGATPSLEISIDTRCSTNPKKSLPGFMLSTVGLPFFPGVHLARAWLSAAWAGYIQHEALELVTVGDLETRPLDPHQPPYAFDRGLRDGMPPMLTPEALERALCVVMPAHVARSLIEEHMPSGLADAVLAELPLLDDAQAQEADDVQTGTADGDSGLLARGEVHEEVRTRLEVVHEPMMNRSAIEVKGE